MSLDAEHCYHLSQPGRSGFKMFLRMSRGLQTRLRTLSEMDGRPGASARASGFRQRGPYSRYSRPSPYFAPTPSAPPPSPSSSPPSFFGRHRISSPTGRRASVTGRFDLLHCTIPEETVSDDSDVFEVPNFYSSSSSSGAASPSRSIPSRNRRWKQPLSIEEILARGTRLPSVVDTEPETSPGEVEVGTGTGMEVAVKKTARDIDRVVRGLKYLAVD